MPAEAGTTAVKENTLHPPHFSTGTWWIISALVTVFFLAVCIPLMPTRKYKLRFACAPILGIALLSGAASLRGHGLEQLLAIYSTVMIAVPLGIIGRGKELKEAARQESMAIGGQRPPAPFKLTVQLAVAILVGFLLWAWLRGWLISP